MSRSYRKTLIDGIAGSKSEKFYKHVRAGQERMKLRNLLAHQQFDDADTELVPWNEWEAGRDGKAWMGDWFEGEVIPPYWDQNWGAWKAGKQFFDPALAKKRRSK